MFQFNEPQGNIKIGVIKPTSGTRRREPWQTDPVVYTNDYHCVNLGGNTQLTFSYEAMTPVSIQLQRNHRIIDSVSGPRAGQVPVPLYNAQHEHHNDTYRMTVTESQGRGRSATASTQLLVQF